MCVGLITLAAAPSVCVLRHWGSCPGGGWLVRAVSFKETSSVPDLGTLFSLSAKMQHKIKFNDM